MKSRLEIIRRLAAEDRGSIVLEASTVFPWAMMITFALILLFIAEARGAAGYYSAAAAAERASFAWSNSAKDIRTGFYPAGRFDDLYWRLKSDALLAGLFGWSPEEREVRVPLADGKAEASGTGPAAKLGKAAADMPSGSSGFLSFRNLAWKQEIKAEMNVRGLADSVCRAFRFPGRPVAVSPVSWVTDPAENIRSFELIRYYRARMKTGRDGGAAYRQTAADVLGHGR